MATMSEAARETAGAGFTEAFVEVDGFAIRYLQAGEGEPIAYLHGGGGLHVSRAHELLAERFRLIAFEMPGFGRSSENTRTASLDELAGTMRRAIAAVGLSDYTLYGTSFGGAVALRVALASPQDIRALVLESPAALRPAGSGPASLSPAELRQALYLRPETAPVPEPPEIVEKQLALLRRLTESADEPQLAARMRDCALPVLVLFGTDDGLISPSIAPRYRQLLVNAYVVYVYRAAHEVQFDRPEAVAEVVGDFAARQEAFLVSTTSTLIDP